MIDKAGLFIVLEGGEGVGKSTLVDILRKSFEKRGHEVFDFREPGGTKFAEDVRDLYLNTEGLGGETVAMLMNAARLDNIENLIVPALNEGKVVIADRFSASTLVYQGIRKGLFEEVLPITQHIPMISIFVDLEPEIAIKRIFENNRVTNRLDLLPLETHEVIYEGYKSLADKLPHLYWDYIIEADKGLKEIEEELDRELVELLSYSINKGNNTAESKLWLRDNIAVYN